MRGFVHHVVLTVHNPEQCFPLYDSVLTDGLQTRTKRRAGLRVVFGDGFWVPFHSCRQGQRGGREAPARSLFARTAHLAWKVDSRAEVDRMHERLLSVGATILDPPAEYPQYNKGRGYYAVFFADADVLKLECVYTPPPSG
jgi:glyoxylase I family protein